MVFVSKATKMDFKKITLQNKTNTRLGWGEHNPLWRAMFKSTFVQPCFRWNGWHYLALSQKNDHMASKRFKLKWREVKYFLTETRATSILPGALKETGSYHWSKTKALLVRTKRNKHEVKKKELTRRFAFWAESSQKNNTFNEIHVVPTFVFEQ